MEPGQQCRRLRLDRLHATTKLPEGYRSHVRIRHAGRREGADLEVFAERRPVGGEAPTLDRSVLVVRPDCDEAAGRIARDRRILLIVRGGVDQLGADSAVGASGESIWQPDRLTVFLPELDPGHDEPSVVAQRHRVGVVVAGRRRVARRIVQETSTRDVWATAGRDDSERGENEDREPQKRVFTDSSSEATGPVSNPSFKSLRRRTGRSYEAPA